MPGRLHARLSHAFLVIYIHDLVDNCENVNIYLLANNAKLYTYIKYEQDRIVLQENVENFVDWTDKLNMPKCKVMLFNHCRHLSSLVPTIYTINNTKLAKL